MPFDQIKADRACQFFERHLRHTKGRYANSPFLLEDWQRGHISEMFGRVNDDGLRQYQQIFWQVPRKNGKSEIGAGIALKLLLADAEPSAEVYSCASDREQAAIVYDVAEQMVRLNRNLSRRCKVTGSKRNISVPKTNAYYRVLSADGGRQHGKNASGVVFDEVHTQRRRALWDAMTMGSDTRSQPMIFAITTAGVPDDAPVWWDLAEYARQIREGIFQDDSFLGIFYGADLSDDFDDPAVWKKANPALGTFLSLEKFRAAWQQARRIPAQWNEFLRYRLNVATQQSDRWLSIADWDACGLTPPVDWSQFRGVPCVAGLDLSTRRDITALVLAFQRDGKTWLRPFFWLPEENLPSRLRPWVQAGHIELTPGSVIDYSFVRARINELAKEFDLQRIAYDPWNANQIAQDLQSDGLEPIEFRFGMRSMTGPSKEFEASLGEKSIVHDGNPVLRWMADCVSIRSDASSGIIPVKPDRLKSEKRIDGIVASIMAFAISKTPEEAAPSILGAF